MDYAPPLKNPDFHYGSRSPVNLGGTENPIQAGRTLKTDSLPNGFSNATDVPCL